MNYNNRGFLPGLVFMLTHKVGDAKQLEEETRFIPSYSFIHQVMHDSFAQKEFVKQTKKKLSSL